MSQPGEADSSFRAPAPAAWLEPPPLGPPPPRPRRRGLLAGALVAGLGLGLVVERSVSTLLVPALDAELTHLESWRPPTTVRVLDARGMIVDRFSLVRRVWVPIDTLPQVLVDAVIAAEDRRFFDHGGVDLLGIARAAASNAWAGRVREGGSTITQQVVKNVLVGSDRTFARKLREALLALRLEQRMDKRSILEIYLNLIYLGSGNYGVEAAARDFLGVPASDLELAGAALLAGLIPAPSRYSPRADPEIARARRNRVLDAMLEEGLVEPEAHRAARAGPVVPPPRDGPARVGGEAFLTEVRREVRRLLGERLPFEAGLRVHTSFDPKLQRAAEAAVRAAAEEVEARQGPRIDLELLDREAQARFLEVTTASTSTTPGSCQPVLHLGGGRLARGEARWTLDVEASRAQAWNPDPDVWAGSFGWRLRPGHVFEVCLGEDGTAAPRAGPRVEGAAVVLDFASGRVRALVGGRAMPLEGFNRATQARRQAGSAFKPFVYGHALDRGLTQLDVLLDAPLALDAGDDRLWEPENASGGFWGLVAMRWAFAFSLNTAAVRLVMDHGTAGVIETARGAGIRSPLRRDLTMALGTSELHPIELAGGIAGIVRGGIAVEPSVIDALRDGRGVEVGRRGERIRLPDVEARLPGGEDARFLEPASAWELVDMMRAVVDVGTGRAAHAEGEMRGGKTGTSSGYKDAWFVGFARGHVVAVWMGRDDGETLGRGESGDRAALPAWTRIVEALPEGPDPVRPAAVLPVRFGDGWVDVAADGVPQARLGHRVPEAPEPLAAAPERPGCRAP